MDDAGSAALRVWGRRRDSSEFFRRKGRTVGNLPPGAAEDASGHEASGHETDIRTLPQVSIPTGRGEALVQRRRRGPAPSRTSHSTTSRPLRDPRSLDTKSLLSWASHDELFILMTLQHTQLDEPQAACVPSGWILSVSVKRRSLETTKPRDTKPRDTKPRRRSVRGQWVGAGAGGGGTRSLCPEPRNLDPRLASCGRTKPGQWVTTRSLRRVRWS